VFSFPSQYLSTIDILVSKQENEISFTRTPAGVIIAQRLERILFLPFIRDFLPNKLTKTS